MRHSLGTRRTFHRRARTAVRRRTWPDYSSSRHNWPTYDGTTDHSNPQRVQVKYSSINVTAVTRGGLDEWQRGQVPNGDAGGLGPSFGGIAHAETEKLGAVVGC